MRKDDPFRIPLEHLRYRSFEFSPLLHECHAHIARHLPVRVLNTPKTGQSLHHEGVELPGLEILNQIRQDQRSSGIVEKFDFSHVGAGNWKRSQVRVPYVPACFP